MSKAIARLNCILRQPHTKRLTILSTCTFLFQIVNCRVILIRIVSGLILSHNRNAYSSHIWQLEHFSFGPGRQNFSNSLVYTERISSRLIIRRVFESITHAQTSFHVPFSGSYVCSFREKRRLLVSPLCCSCAVAYAPDPPMTVVNLSVWLSLLIYLYVADNVINARMNSPSLSPAHENSERLIPKPSVKRFLVQ